MTEREYIEYVHKALFRVAPQGLPNGPVPEGVKEHVADALYAAASRAGYVFPQPIGNPNAGWLFSFDVEKWLAENDTSVRHDLAMHVSSAFTPVAESAQPKRRR